MKLPREYNWVPIVGALLYGVTTPIGIAVGLGVRTTYNPNTEKASIVSGVLDAMSSGILIYTGLVEVRGGFMYSVLCCGSLTHLFCSQLLAHEFLFNREMMNGPTNRIVFSIGVMMLGAGLMALLGKWA